jgi:hypothetical protein
VVIILDKIGPLEMLFYLRVFVSILLEVAKYEYMINKKFLNETKYFYINMYVLMDF